MGILDFKRPKIIGNKKKIRPTRKLIFDNLNDEFLMEHYLGVPVTNKLFKNPLRNPTKATASFSRTPDGTLMFRDFNGSYWGDAIYVASVVYGITYNEAITKICQDFNLLDDDEAKDIEVRRKLREFKNKIKVNDSPSIINVSIKKWDDKNLKFWNDFGITLPTLEKYNVYPISAIWINGKNFFFYDEYVFGYYFGKKNGIEQWKIYFPFGKKIRFLGNTSRLQGFRQLPKSGEFIVHTKSMKDVMSFHELGIPAVAKHGESMIFSLEEFIEIRIRFPWIFDNRDWDRAGCRGMWKSRRMYNTTPVSFVNQIPVKDFSDYVKAYGKDAAFELIYNYINEWEKLQEIRG